MCLLYMGTPRTTQQSLQNKLKPLRLSPVPGKSLIITQPVCVIINGTVLKAMKIMVVADKVIVVALEPLSVLLPAKATPIAMAARTIKVVGIKTVPLPRPLPLKNNNGALKVRLNFINNLV